MVDKSVGTAGTLRITDDGTTVRYYVLCDDPATNVGTYRYAINGTNYTTTLPSGFGSKLLGTRTYSSSGTASLSQEATGTQGLGGAAFVSMTIDRATVPSAPGKPTVSLVDSDQATVAWTATSNGGSAILDYGVYVSEYSDFRSHVFQNWIGVVTSYRLPVGTLSPGIRYWTRVRAQNVKGVGAYSASTEFWSQPSAPTGFTVTRVSDSQQTLNWSNPQTASSVVVQRSTAGGAWQTLATLSGNVTTFTDKSTTGNQKYTYRVQVKNPSASSAWSSSVTVYTTPAAPTGVSAARSGGNVIVSAGSVPPYAAGFDVRDGSTVIASNVSLPYTHVAVDPAVPHTYTVRAVRSSPNVLASAWSSPSNTVQLLTAPNAPTGLVPNGSVWPSDTDVLFRWSHNAVDSSPQSAYELRYRLDGGAWTTVTGTTAMTRTVTIGVAAVDWQVRTKGSHPDWSPWSSVATFTIIDRPGVAVVQPAGTWDASVLVVEWTWFQAQGRPQSGWRFELLNAANELVESRDGSGATGFIQAGTRLSEGMWTVRVQAATGEVWSAWGSETFTVAFIPPAAPRVSGTWDESSGGVQLAVVGESYGVASLVAGVWYAEIGV